MNQTTTLAALQKGREKRAITVRVIRKWTQKANGGQGQPLYVGMVFADATGNALYAEIPEQFIADKAHFLQVGKIYDIKKFRVAPSKTSFRVLDKPFMIEVTEDTSIELTRNPVPDIPEYIYTITPFSSLVASGSFVSIYTDVIGYVTKYGAVNSFVPKNKEKVVHLREIYIKDLKDIEMKVTLWGEEALNFTIDNIYDEKAGNIIVCLIVGCSPRSIYGDDSKVFLSGSQACSYYLNPLIPEANMFYSRFKDTPVYIDCPPRAEQTPPITVVDTPLKLMTVADLNAISEYDFENATYKCAVTIASIVENSAWWYRSCKQDKKKMVQQPDSTYRCPRCNGSKLVRRYLLSFIAGDVTGEARFFAHDDEAKLIVGKDCESIMNPLAYSTDLPKDLQNIIDKRYVFSISLSDNAVRQYDVKAVLERPLTRRGGQSHSATSARLPVTSPDQVLRLPQPALSDASIQDPPAQREVIQVDSLTEKTPPPSAGLDHISTETTKTSPSSRSASARRNLSEAFDNTHKVLTDEDERTLATGAIDDDRSRSSPKRIKGSNSGTSSKDGARKSSSNV